MVRIVGLSSICAEWGLAKIPKNSFSFRSTEIQIFPYSPWHEKCLKEVMMKWLLCSLVIFFTLSVSPPPLVSQPAFDATEVIEVTPKEPEGRITIRLKAGEIRKVFHHDNKKSDTEHAFYLPPEARSLVELVVEKGWGKRTYFLKGKARGETVGGVVERRWLDSRVRDPRSEPDEARIQAAIRKQPVFIVVE